MTTKVIINGQEVIGDVDFIRSLLGFESVSAKSPTTTVEKTTKKSKKSKVDTYFDSVNLVQRQNEVVDLGTTDVPKGKIATGYKMEYIEQFKIWRISHSICSSSRYKDRVTGEDKVRKFNKYPKSLANNEIKKLATMAEFKGQLYIFDMPFSDGSGKCFKAWGFKSKDLATKALEILPKWVDKEQPKKEVK